MAIPTYAVIADSEIDPESPLTSSLMFRLRDNILALLGIDPATPSPTMNIGESVNSKRSLIVLASAGLTGTGWATGAEVAISTITGISLESIEVIPPLSGGWHMQIADSNGIVMQVVAIKVPYASSVPQSVSVWCYVSPTTGSTTWLEFTSPNDNTYRSIVTASSLAVQVKTRLDATTVYIQFRAGNGTSGAVTSLSLRGYKTEYRAKNAATA